MSYSAALQSTVHYILCVFFIGVKNSKWYIDLFCFVTGSTFKHFVNARRTDNDDEMHSCKTPSSSM